MMQKFKLDVRTKDAATSTILFSSEKTRAEILNDINSRLNEFIPPFIQIENSLILLKSEIQAVYLNIQDETDEDEPQKKGWFW